MRLLLAEDEVDMSEAWSTFSPITSIRWMPCLMGKKHSIMQRWRVTMHHIGYHDAEDEWPGGVAEAAEPR